MKHFDIRNIKLNKTLMERWGYKQPVSEDEELGGNFEDSALYQRLYKHYVDHNEMPVEIENSGDVGEFILNKVEAEGIPAEINVEGITIPKEIEVRIRR